MNLKLNYLLHKLGWRDEVWDQKLKTYFDRHLKCLWLSFVLGVEYKILMQLYYTLRWLIKQILKKNMETYFIPYHYTFLCLFMKMYKILNLILVLKIQCAKYTINLNQRIRQKNKNQNFHITGLKSDEYRFDPESFRCSEPNTQKLERKWPPNINNKKTILMYVLLNREVFVQSDPKHSENSSVQTQFK